MNKNIDELFKQDNKRIDNSLQSELNHKITSSIKNKSLRKSIILIIIALIGAGFFAWNLGSLTLF